MKSRTAAWKQPSALALVVIMTASASGCAEISTSTRDEYRAAGVERVELDPTYEPQVTARLNNAENFEQAHLVVEARQLKTCRTQTVKLREKVIHTVKEIEKPAIVTAKGLLAVGGFACAAAHFGGSGCITKEGETTGESPSFTDTENKGWGAGFAALGAVATSLVFADLVRSADETEVVSVERRPVQTKEEPCGAEPNASAVVKVYPTGGDAAPYTARTDSDGKVSIPLTELALEHISAGDSVGRVVVGQEELAGEPFPSRWLASQQTYYDQLRFGEARAADTAEAYLEYLRAFPDGAYTRQAHLDFQGLAVKRPVADALSSYLSEFGNHPLVRASEEQLRTRLRTLQVEKAYQAYVATWELDRSADAAELADPKAAAMLRERLFAFHQQRLEQAREAEADFEVMRTNYEASISVAPSPARAKAMRDELAALLMQRAKQLREQQDVVPGTQVLGLYAQAIDWSETPRVAKKARRAALDFALIAFEQKLPEAVEPGETAGQLEFLLREADAYAQTPKDDERVEKARIEYADRSAKGLLSKADAVAEESEVATNVEVVALYERALELARGDKVKRRARSKLVSYLAGSISREVSMISAGSVSVHEPPADVLMARGLQLAENTRQRDILKNAWIDAYAEHASEAAEADSFAQVANWVSWLEIAGRYADSSTSKKQLRHRRRAIERKLHKRYPPAKLESLQQAVIIYPPTVDLDDMSAHMRALKSPRSNQGERVVVALEIERTVGDKYLAEAQNGQRVFIYSSNKYARSRLRVGRKVGVLGTIDGSIPYRKNGKRIYLPRLDIIWVGR